MKIIIFGGTTEGRELAVILAKEGAEVTVSVASDYGAEELSRDRYFAMKDRMISVEEGRKNEEEICRMINGADLCIDATHPYAVTVTENIRKAAETEKVELIRLSREKSESEGVIMAQTMEEAAAIAASEGGRVLLTTGTKDVDTFAGLLDIDNLFPRVLPVSSSVEKCQKAGIPNRNIIAVQGPFSEAFNRAIIEEYRIDVLITKDSGRTGGFNEKIEACRNCGIPVIVVARPEEEGLPFDRVLEVCRAKMKDTGRR